MEMKDVMSKLIDPLYEPLDMSSGGNRLSKLYLDLLATFELRRASWLMQSGLLFEVYPGCTHTRRAHSIGCWIVGWHSLDDIKVYGSKPNKKISLRNWLKKKVTRDNIIREYLTSLLLHDIGHPPFSHTLEMSPFMEDSINHEEITKSLVCNMNDKNNINWHALLVYFLCAYKVSKVTSLKKESYEKTYQNYKKDVKTVNSVLKKYRIKMEVMEQILSGLTNSDPRTYALHMLIDSQVDIDRIDHFLRDSYYSGIKFADYKTKALLQNLVIVPEGTEEYEKIITANKKDQKMPAYMMIRKEGVEQVEYLLTARQFIFDMVLWHPQNLMLIGALNMAIRMLIKYEPFILSILPFLTDQILLQMLREKSFIGTSLEGYEKIIRGEIPINEFHCIVDEVIKNYNPKYCKEKIRDIYDKIENYNSKMPLAPKVLIFSNFKKEQDQEGTENWWKNVIFEENYKSLEKSDKVLFTWLSQKEKNRLNRILIWTRSGVNLEKDVGLPRKLNQFFKECWNYGENKISVR